MAFKRYALATDVEILEKPKSGTIAFEEDDKIVSFEYDAENNIYFRCRAITANTPNGNGDLFEEEELRKSYKTFIGVGLFMDHNSESVDQSIGKVIWAELIKPKDDNAYVQCYCVINKKLAPDMAERVQSGLANTVSMGCMVGEAVCGIDGCGNVAHNQNELCKHMDPHGGVKGKKGENGELVFEYNRMLQFTELSLVTVPADPTAHIFEVYAALKAKRISGAMARAEIHRIISETVEDRTREQVQKYVQEAVPRILEKLESISPSGNGTSDGTTKIDIDKNDDSTTSSSGITTIHIVDNEFIKDQISSSPSSSPEGEVKEVARNGNSTEEQQMKLTIDYVKGSDLTNSFFVAKEAGAEYKVPAASVLPLFVQQAISQGQTGVATPAQIVEDLLGKYATLREFKNWAKKRKKKNKKAKEKMLEKKDDKKDDKEDDKKDDKKEAASEPCLEHQADPEAVSDPAADAPSAEGTSGTNPLDPAPVSDDPHQDRGDKGDEGHMSDDPTGAPDQEFSAEELQRVMRFLEQFMKQQPAPAASSQKGPKKVAVKTESPKAPADGQHGDKSGKAPAAMQEIAKTESPSDYTDKGTGKGHVGGTMPKGAKSNGTKRVAIDQNWSVNPKELEKPAKMGKPKQAVPEIYSANEKEVASEQVKHDTGSAGGSNVPKYYGRLPSKGLGEAPKAWDAKSKKMLNDNIKLKADKDKLQSEKEALESEKHLQSVADKIYEIVKALRERNFLTADREDEIISLIGGGFKDEVSQMDQLTTLLNFVSALSTQPAAAATTDAGGTDDVDTAVPQVFEEITQTEDAVSTMSKIWNL